MVFVSVSWVAVGGNSVSLHLGLLVLCLAIFGIGILCVRRSFLRGVLLISVAVALGLCVRFSWVFHESVLVSARNVSLGPYCIYFPQAERFFRNEERLTFLTMEKSRSAYQNRHAILVWAKNDKLQTAYWSYQRRQFIFDYYYGNLSIGRYHDRFHACLAK